MVGGNLSFTNGSVKHGDVRVGHTASVSGMGIDNGKLFFDTAGSPAPPSWMPQQQVAGGGIAPGFFTSAQSYAESLSASLAAMATNGNVGVNPYGKITLEAVSSGLNVFNITAAQFEGATGQGIILKADANSTVVVNIVGSGSTVLNASNFAFELQGGLLRDHIVYNFKGISTIQTANLGYLGSILAPNSVFAGTYGAVDGDVVVAGVRGTTEFHNVPFAGSLPPPSSAVPEPATLAGAAIGLGAFAWRRRRS